MSRRLASFRGPSTPSTVPVLARQLTSPSSPSRNTESTFHRKLRVHLHELRTIAETWDDLVRIDGVKAAKSLIDARTDLDNEIALLPDKKPRSAIVGPKLAFMDKCVAELDVITDKLRKQFGKMNSVIDKMEGLLMEAHKTKGWQFVHEEVLWVTWTLEKFVTSVPSILIPYHRSLQTHIEIIHALRSHSISFEDSRLALAKWISQPDLEGNSWKTQWEDLCSIEVERWDS